MRTIFITPLLWKRVDRAMRRRNEGQALVLVALTAIGMVAMVGLAIDGGLAFMEAQKIQRAADAAALSGAVWMPSLKSIADSRGELASQANGYDAVNHGTTDSSVSQADQTGNIIYYAGSTTNDPTQYQATIGHVAHRWFLGIIGFGNFYIQRSAIAQYSSLPRLGSSDNYFGSSVLFDEHDRLDINGINKLLSIYYGSSSGITCSRSQPGTATTNNTDISWLGKANDPAPAWLHYYCGLYLHTLYQSCQMRPYTTFANSANACLGTFWLSIFSPDIFADNGDAYNVGADGGNNVSGSGAYGVVVPSKHSNGYGQCNRQLYDTETWDYLLVDGPNGPCPQTSNYDAANPTIVNFNQSPDDPSLPTTNGLVNARGFGYEIAVEVNGDALLPDTNSKLHTALNVSIFGAGNSYVGNDITFGPPVQYGTGDVWNGNGGNDSSYNGSAVAGLTNDTGTTASTFSPYSNNHIQGSQKQTNPVMGAGSIVPEHLPIDRENVTRFMLFLPPTAPGTPTTWNSKGAPVISVNGNTPARDTFVTDSNSNIQGTALVAPELSWFGSDKSVTQPVTNTSGTSIPCVYWNTLNLSGQGTPDQSFFNSGSNKNCSGSSSSTTPGSQQYCYVVDPEWLNGNTPGGNYATGLNLTNNAKLFYVCPPTNGGAGDRYWNQLYGSPSVSDLGRSATKVGSGNSYQEVKGFTYDNSNNPLVEQYLQPMFYTGTYAYGNTTITTTNTPTDMGNTVDPGQACRPIAPLDNYWGNDRIPFNMRGADWTSQVVTASLTNFGNVGTSKDLVSTPLLTQYFSYHGNRCSWDFDSAAYHDQYGPDFNPLNPVVGQTTGMVGCSPAGANATGSDAGNLMDSPFITSFAAYNTQIDGAWQTYGVKTSPFANVSCYEPFFHITNWHWQGSNVVTDTTSMLVAGTYLLHVQEYGGSGQHRYAVKAEYENPATVQLPLAGSTTVLETQLYSVPHVYGLNNFSIYTNGQIQGTTTGSPTINHTIFDLASIPASDHDFTAIMEFWDVGDVGSHLNIGLLYPSGFGKGYGYQYQDASGTTKFMDPTQSDGLDRLNTRYISFTDLRILPYNQSYAPQEVKPAGVVTQVVGTNSSGSALNGEWLDAVFQLPDQNYYNNLATQCAANKVPDTDCYYYQVDYELINGNSCPTTTVNGSSVKNCGIQYADDTTTWQLYIQNQPVHLVQ